MNIAAHTPVSAPPQTPVATPKAAASKPQHKQPNTPLTQTQAPTKEFVNAHIDYYRGIEDNSNALRKRRSSPIQKGNQFRLDYEAVRVDGSMGLSHFTKLAKAEAAHSKVREGINKYCKNILGIKYSDSKIIERVKSLVNKEKGLGQYLEGDEINELNFYRGEGQLFILALTCKQELSKMQLPII